MNKRLIYLVTLLMIFSMGCDKTQPPPAQKQLSGFTQLPANQATRINKMVNRIDGVDDVTTVISNKYISTGIKVTGLDRWNLKSIKSRAHAMINRSYPGYTVYLTSDKKLFKELNDIEVDLTNGKPVKNLPNRLKKINQKMNG